MPNAEDRPASAELSKVNIPKDLHLRGRAAVRIVRKVTGRRYTFAQFLREAIVAQLAVITRDYNGGHEIYPDGEPLDPGRQ